MFPELECSWSSRVSNQRKLLSLRGPLTTLFSHSKEGGGGGGEGGGGSGEGGAEGGGGRGAGPRDQRGLSSNPELLAL